jgi:hypothetical protein
LTSERRDETEHSRREPEQQHWTSEGTETRRGGEARSGRSGGRGGRQAGARRSGWRRC